MDQMVANFNAATCALLAALAGWGVMSPRVRDGVVIKAGLISLSIGFAATALLHAAQSRSADHGIALDRAAVLIHLGQLLVAVGWALRIRSERRQMRRFTDFHHKAPEHHSHATH